MEITKSGSQPSARGPADWFTGSVRIDSPFQRPAPARIGGATVTFEPGARTAWHTHPRGQTLIVTAGVGRVQIEGGPIEEIRPGDVVWIPPGKRHLAWRLPYDGDDPPRHPGAPERQGRRVDGEGHGRAVHKRRDAIMSTGEPPGLAAVGLAELDPDQPARSRRDVLGAGALLELVH